MAAAVAFQTERFGVRGFVSRKKPRRLELPRRLDLISVISLFSHLPQATFAPWLSKLVGALDDSGILVFTTQGPGFYEKAFGRTMDSDFVFNPSSEIPSLDTKSYGQTFCTAEFVAEIMDSIPSAELLAQVPLGLNRHQDVYVVGVGVPRPGTPCKLRAVPDLIIDDARWESGCLHAVGWALDAHQRTPLPRIEVYVDGALLGSADRLERPDLAPVFGPQAVPGGWTFIGEVAQGGHMAVLVWDDRGLHNVAVKQIR